MCPLVRSLQVALFALAACLITGSAGAVTIATGTDTFLQNDQPDAANGSELVWEWDGEDPPGSGANPNHGLLGFDLNLDQPDPGVGTLRERILATPSFSATLRLEIVNAGDPGDLYRLTQAFDDSTSWNSFGGGVAPGSNAEGVSNASVPQTSSTGWVEVDVTADLLAWAGGAADYGWGFLPTGTNGVEIASFEAGSGGPELTLTGASSDYVTEGPSGTTWQYYDTITYPDPNYPQDADCWLDSAPGAGRTLSSDHSPPTTGAAPAAAERARRGCYPGAAREVFR